MSSSIEGGKMPIEIYGAKLKNLLENGLCPTSRQEVPTAKTPSRNLFLEQEPVKRSARTDAPQEVRKDPTDEVWIPKARSKIFVKIN